VPEVAAGSVEIRAIVREPGNRAKVAVYSNQSGIDPVGSCVGQKGVRVQAIIQEFNGLEKIDIIQWQDQPILYVEQALSPAKHVTVKVNEEEKTAHVVVPQDELSLAIGKDGQNVRLASRLTGYRIEIEGMETEMTHDPLTMTNEETETKIDNGEVKMENTEESEEEKMTPEEPTVNNKAETKNESEDNKAEEHVTEA